MIELKYSWFQNFNPILEFYNNFIVLIVINVFLGIIIQWIKLFISCNNLYIINNFYYFIKILKYFSIIKI